MLRVNTTVVAVVAPEPGDTTERTAHRARWTACAPPTCGSSGPTPARRRSIAPWRHGTRPGAPARRISCTTPTRWRGWPRPGLGGSTLRTPPATSRWRSPRPWARWRGRSLDLPDYYLVVDPESLRPTLRHWYLGVIGSAAPARVVTGRPGTPVIDQLPGLRPGPWWPDLDRILADIDRVVPDQAGLPTPSAGVDDARQIV